MKIIALIFKTVVVTITVMFTLIGTGFAIDALVTTTNDHCSSNDSAICFMATN